MRGSFAFLLFLFSLTSLDCLIPSTTKAQITPDGTTSTTVEQTDNDFTIEQGDRVGDNLFHSFDEFSVPTGGSAGFNNAADIANIFSRVTGGNISNIDGLLSANGTANLFLINPNGIVFGANARLDIGGSFYASTANSLLFEGDTEFSAVNPQAAPLLEVSIPIGLSFRDDPNDIINSSVNGLSVGSQKTLALIGGDVAFDNAFPLDNLFIALEDVKVNELGFKTELGGLLKAGVITIAEDGSLDYPADNISKADVFIVNDSSVGSISAGEATVTINARNFTSINSKIINGVFSISDASDARSGKININAAEDVSIKDSNIINDLRKPGEAGDINISAKNISLTDNSVLSSSVLSESQGKSANINLAAKENITLTSSNVFNQVLSDVGNSGDITVTAQSLLIENRAEVRSSSLDTVNSSNLNLNVADEIVITGDSRISNILETSEKIVITDESLIPIRIKSSENVIADTIRGDVNLKATKLSVVNDSSIELENKGIGDGSDLNITAETIVVDGRLTKVSNITDTPRLLSDNEKFIQNTPGNINIEANSLSLTNGAKLDTSSFRSINKNAGGIKITARDNVLIDGGNRFNRGIKANFFVASGNSGNSNGIEINTSELLITNGAIVSASLEGLDGGEGKGGDLIINATDSLEVSNNAQIIADVNIGNIGKGGNLTVETAKLRIDGGGQISASTLGSGEAGNLTIRATDSIKISGGNDGGRSALLAVALEEDGKGGNLSIVTQDLSIDDGGVISVGNFPTVENIPLILRSVIDPGTGEPGSLDIEANSISLENGGSIEAATQSPVGDGADINIASEAITLDNNALISARAFEEADGGNLSIASGFVLAFPDGNNDIVARAEQGNGGRINIDTEAIFGLEERLSEPANFTNDIDASSEFGLQGDFSLNTPDFDPTSGLIELPASVGDASDQISQNPCEQGVGSELIVTGKGGLPPSPDSLNSGDVRVGLVEPSDLTPSPSPSKRGEQDKQGEEENEEAGIEAGGNKALNSDAQSVPAQGWIMNDKGEVTLTAIAPNDERVNRREKSSAVCSRTNE